MRFHRRGRSPQPCASCRATPGCDASRRRGCERTGENRTATRHSASGRLADSPYGPVEDGNAYPPDPGFWGIARRSIRPGPGRLLEHSRAPAHEEGPTFYTAVIGGAREAKLGTSEMLANPCSGAASIPESGRGAFLFQADGPESLAAAFREVGHRLLGSRGTMQTQRGRRQGQRHMTFGIAMRTCAWADGRRGGSE